MYFKHFAECLGDLLTGIETGSFGLNAEYSKKI